MRLHASLVKDGPGPPVAGVSETHLSILNFVGDRVYKLKKPIDLGFVDFTSREAREADCRREVVLNRRLAPDVYLGVADLAIDSIPVDHMVVMRALPEALNLANFVQEAQEVRNQLDAVAQRLASFHEAAERSPQIAASGTSDALLARWTDDFDETARFVGSVLDPAVESDVRSLVGHWLVTHTDILTDRIKDGHVCDGHGDLQASDIFCLDDGVRILDCLEFSDSLRYGDVCGDVAFLAMDLERLGHRAAAVQFVQAYEHHTDTHLPRTLLHFHIALRAYIRAKVACIRSEQGSDSAADDGRALHLLARRHLFQARRTIALVGGLPGSGKSTLARNLADELGWALESSDVVRPELVVGPDRYGRQAVGSVYAEMFRRARDHLRAGTSVILDASWIDADERAQAALVAEQMKAELVELQCMCPDPVAAQRIRDRLVPGRDASEASVVVRSKMATQMDPWRSQTAIDTSGSPAETLERALEAIVGAERSPLLDLEP